MSKYQLKCPGVTIYEIEDFLHFKADFLRILFFIDSVLTHIVQE